MSNEERIEQLQKNIEKWEKELNEVWRDTNTDAAEVERRNLRNLIANARREIDQLNGVVQDNLDDMDPEKLLEQLKAEKKDREATINRLKLHIERLKEEREDYKNNKSLYNEYTKKINETQKELRELQKAKSREEKDKNLRILTRGRMQQEAERRRIESEIRRKLQEISEIEYDTPQAMEEVELSSGEKVRNPKVLRLYSELDQLRASLNKTTSKINEYQEEIDEINEVDRSTRTPRDLSPEEVRYFHGQGDLREYGGENGEDTRNNRLANDEYFGLRGRRGNGPTNPTPTEPTPTEPTPTEPTPTVIITPTEPTPTEPTPTEPTPTVIITPTEPTPTDPTPGVEIEKSGLQIFREQFNQMPVIENKHTLSERFDIAMPLGMPAAAALSAFVNPFLGIPVLAGTIVAKPIIYRATGQKKLEEQITQQFLEMDEGEFNKMVDYLSEERQADLKPNAVILNALHKAMLVRAKEAKQRLDGELESLQTERDELLEKGEENLTEEEKQRLGEIGERIISITDYTTDSDGKRGPSESDKVSRRLKEVRRGKDRISARYKGNMGSRLLNIFHHRNSTTEEYKKPINDYADAEKSRDVARATGDTVKANQEQKHMDQVIEDNTVLSKRGISKGVFNARKGAVRIISDVKDRTVKIIASLATIGIGLGKFAVDRAKAAEIQAANEQKYSQLQAQHNSDVNRMHGAVGRINQGEVQSAATGKVTEQGLAKELEIENIHGDYTPQYHADDLRIQQEIGSAAQNSHISGQSAGDYLHDYARVIRSGIPGANDLASSATNPVMTQPTLNAHGTFLGLQQDYPNQVASEANLVDKCADLADAAEKMQTVSGSLDSATVSWTGPIILAVNGFASKVRGWFKGRKQSKENDELESSQKYEEIEEIPVEDFEEEVEENHDEEQEL